MCVFGERCEQSPQRCVCVSERVHACVLGSHSHSKPYGQKARCWTGNRENQLVHTTSQEEPWVCRNGSAHTTNLQTASEPEQSLTSSLCMFFFNFLCLILWFFLFAAMLQADDEDDMMEMQMKSPFGSSFRTFNATDYKPIGKTSCPHLA